jgi:hypothetical protein
MTVQKKDFFLSSVKGAMISERHLRRLYLSSLLQGLLAEGKESNLLENST